MVMEMYVSGVVSAVMLLAFFLGIKKSRCDLYYRLVGKDGPFYIFILHMAVSEVLELFMTFDSGLVQCGVVFALSFALYEAGYGLSCLYRRLRERRVAS